MYSIVNEFSEIQENFRQSHGTHTEYRNTIKVDDSRAFEIFRKTVKFMRC